MIREMQLKTTRYQNDLNEKKIVTTKFVKEVEKLDHSHIAGRNLKGHSHSIKQFSSFF